MTAYESSPGYQAYIDAGAAGGIELILFFTVVILAAIATNKNIKKGK